MRVMRRVVAALCIVLCINAIFSTSNDKNRGLLGHLNPISDAKAFWFELLAAGWVWHKWETRRRYSDTPGRKRPKLSFKERREKRKASRKRCVCFR